MSAVFSAEWFGRADDQKQVERPNIVFVLADDLGWSELALSYSMNCLGAPAFWSAAEECNGSAAFPFLRHHPEPEG
jgi:hypothetical protein